MARDRLPRLHAVGNNQPKVTRSGVLAPKPDNCTMLIVEIVLAPGADDNQTVLDIAHTVPDVLTVTRIDQ